MRLLRNRNLNCRPRQETPANGRSLCLVFPGIGYHCDKPLLYYARKIFSSKGYDVVCCEYKLSGGKDDAALKKVFAEACSQSGVLLSSVDFSAYQKIVCVSKSIGSAVSFWFCKEHSLKAFHVVFTPVPLTFEQLSLCETRSLFEGAVVFHGTKDPLCDNSVCKKHCAENSRIKRFTVRGGNHSLECGNVVRDLATLLQVMRVLKKV